MTVVSHGYNLKLPIKAKIPYNKWRILIENQNSSTVLNEKLLEYNDAQFFILHLVQFHQDRQ